MSISRRKQLLALAFAFTGASAATSTLAQQPATTPAPAQAVVVAQADTDKDKPHNLSNTCLPGSAAAVMSAKYPPHARPGKPEIYKDCR